MTTDTANKITGFIRANKQATAKQLIDYIGISRQAVFRQLARLQTKNLIYKIGTPPKVFYFIKEPENTKKTNNGDNGEINPTIQKLINDNYLIITPSGERKQGMEGFRYWCDRTGQPVRKTSREFYKTWKKYNKYKREGLIDGTNKLKNTFTHCYVDRLYYLDFYSIERFGKTKLGQLLLYAKQSQNISLIKEIVVDYSPLVKRLIKKWKIDAVGFIPPTVKREVQFMKELERLLYLKINKIPLIKVKTEVAVPQKTLSKLEDRIENARNTIIVDEKKQLNNILLIDDAVGSGATINETASQIKIKGICKRKIIGLSITGSFKGFDIISEV